MALSYDETQIAVEQAALQAQGALGPWARQLVNEKCSQLSAVSLAPHPAALSSPYLSPQWGRGEEVRGEEKRRGENQGSNSKAAQWRGRTSEKSRRSVVTIR
jgi:hypothetical protein